MYTYMYQKVLILKNWLSIAKCKKLNVLHLLLITYPYCVCIDRLTIDNDFGQDFPKEFKEEQMVGINRGVGVRLV